jgi:Major royal jelly protein
MFFTQLKKDGLACWNPSKSLSAATFPLIASDSEKLIFPNDVKVEEGGILWTITDNMAEFLYGTPDINKTNYRVFVADTEELVKGTVCAPN